jgi:hypothetical protein
MARVYGIEKRLEKRNTDEKLIKEIIGNGDLINIIKRMEQSLEPEILYEILGSCACTGGKEYLKSCEKIGKEIANKTLKEKIDFLNKETDYIKNTFYNDNTLTNIMFQKENDRYKCYCSAAVRNGSKVSDLALKNDDLDAPVMPLSYCFCCAESILLHLQLKLGIELKTKKIVSSPINSKGEKPCEIIFEIFPDTVYNLNKLMDNKKKK